MAKAGHIRQHEEAEEEKHKQVYGEPIWQIGKVEYGAHAYRHKGRPDIPMSKETPGGEIS
jgi:hypothetical protein